MRASFGVFLDREATAEEVTSWSGRFASGEHRSRLPNELANSDEWLGVEVAKLYRAALDREPDAGGRAYWVDQLRRGALVNRVGSLVYGSPEFYARAGGTPVAFVDDIYARILGRSADADGREYWLGQVDRLGRGRVASLFFASTESRTGRVRALYQQVLGRPADAGGLSYWVGQLATVNDVRLAVLLASSSEFYDRHGGCEGTGTIVRVTDAAGGGDPDVSADGRHVAFVVPEPDKGDLVSNVFLWDRTTGEAVRVTDGNSASGAPSVSADGRYVAFDSYATDIVPGDTNGNSDVFVWDRTDGATIRITDSVGADAGAFAPSISGDGQLVAFVAYDAGFISEDVWIWDRASGVTDRVVDGDLWSGSPEISTDGRYVAFHSAASDIVAGDTNGNPDVFVWDRSTGSIAMITDSVGDFGAAFSPSMSAAGDHIVYEANTWDDDGGGGAADVFVWDRATGSSTQLTEGRSSGELALGSPSISGDGRYVAYDMLSEGDGEFGRADVYVTDLTTDSVTIPTVGADDFSIAPVISADGRFVAFSSYASNLVPGDDNDAWDVFLWDRDG